ncbi:hypothetical protein BASA81_001906 [Batrachochytrium salamandrivorans]|nr:hypothetical protein BASA81_001906 [Batrachochytrium salamandrivorans]
MSAKLKLTLYFDVISPYTYMAWTFLQRYKQRWNLDLDLKPIFLGGIMHGTGNQPPAMLPARSLFMAQDLHRTAAMMQAPMLPTASNFLARETNKLILAWQRIFTARLMDGASNEEVEQLISNAMFAFHADPKNRTADNDMILTDQVIASIFHGVNRDQAFIQGVIARSESAEVKQKLNQTTKEAIEAGAYGAPTMLIHGGLAPYYDGTKPIFVFGSDRFEQIAFMCGLKYEGPCPPVSKL